MAVCTKHWRIAYPNFQIGEAAENRKKPSRSSLALARARLWTLNKQFFTNLKEILGRAGELLPFLDNIGGLRRSKRYKLYLLILPSAATLFVVRGIKTGLIRPPGAATDTYLSTQDQLTTLPCSIYTQVLWKYCLTIAEIAEVPNVICL